MHAISTQWDSFAHAGSTFDLNDDGKDVPCFHNGYRAGRSTCCRRKRAATNMRSALGIDRFAVKAIQSRGVMIDLEKHFGRAEKTVMFEEMQNVIIHDGVTVEPGDMVCIHTGFGAELLKMERKPDPDRLHHMCTALKGSDSALHNWLTEKKVSALCADNFAVEKMEATPTKMHRIGYRCISTACSSAAFRLASCGSSPSSPNTCAPSGVIISC